jgi:hypothetical protein
MYLEACRQETQRRNEEKGSEETELQTKDEPSAGVLGHKSLAEVAMASLSGAADRTSNIAALTKNKGDGAQQQRQTLKGALVMGSTMGRVVMALKTPVNHRTAVQLKLIQRVTSANKFFMQLDSCAASNPAPFLSTRARCPRRSHPLNSCTTRSVASLPSARAAPIATATARPHLTGAAIMAYHVGCGTRQR